MIFLYGYLAIGVLVVITYTSKQSLAIKLKASCYKDILFDKSPNHNKRKYIFLKNVFELALVMIVVVCVWPVPLYYKIKDVFSTGNVHVENDENKFTVKSNDLKKQLTLEEIEIREMVDDPLGAVPNLPFGHLNKAWNTFLEERKDGDEIWSFSGQENPYWRQKELLTGYVLVMDGKPGVHFLTVSKLISDDE